MWLTNVELPAENLTRICILDCLNQFARSISCFLEHNSVKYLTELENKKKHVYRARIRCMHACVSAYMPSMNDPDAFTDQTVKSSRRRHRIAAVVLRNTSEFSTLHNM